MFVVAAKAQEPMTAEDQVAARRELVAGLAADDLQLTFTETDPGRLGGWFGCGTAATAAAGSTRLPRHGHAAVVLVVLRGSKDPAADARRMREAVVRR